MLSQHSLADNSRIPVTAIPTVGRTLSQGFAEGLVSVGSSPRSVNGSPPTPCHDPPRLTFASQIREKDSADCSAEQSLRKSFTSEQARAADMVTSVFACRVLLLH